MNSEALSQIDQRLSIVYTAAFWALLAIYLGWKGKLWSFPFGIQKIKSLSFYKVFSVFVIFLTSQLLLLPLITYFFFSYTEKHWLKIQELNFDPTTQGWINVFGIIMATSLVLLYLACLPKETKEDVWGDRTNAHNFVKNCLLGIVSWLIIFPIVLIVGQLIEIPLTHYFHYIQKDQVAVKFIKTALDSKFLFISLTLAVAVIVPFAEEILFRGFLQGWLKTKVSTKAAVILTSIIFASFHFSFSQGISNIELLTSLFVLSCFLGFLRERQHSLLTSISLHSTFNLISIMMILMGS